MQEIAAVSRLEVRTLAESSLDVAVAAFAAAFAGYQVPVALTPAQFDARFRGENGDPFASYVFSAAKQPVAILMITRRGWESRVAAMGISPAMRGTGLGAEVIRRAVSAARARGDARLVLEVIQSNERAVKLYRRAGFEVVRPLWGFAIDAARPGPAGVASAREIDPAVGVLRAGCFDTAALPWQLQIPSLAAMVRPTRCFIDADRSIVAMVDPSQETVRLRALAFDAGISPGEAVDFTASLRAVFPGRPWAAPAIFTDAHRERFFTPAGWATAELRQFEMCHPLDTG